MLRGKFKRVSLSQRIWGVGLPLAVVACAVQISLVWGYRMNEVERDARHRAESLLQAARINVQTFESESAIRRTLNALMSANRDVDEFYVLGAPDDLSDVVILASGDHALAGKVAIQHLRQDAWDHIDRTFLRGKGEVIVGSNELAMTATILMRTNDRSRTYPGVAYIHLSTTAKRHEALVDALTMGGLLGSLVVVAITFLLTLIRSQVLKPLGQLRDSMERKIESGRFKPLDIPGHGELSDLANSYNDLMLRQETQEARMSAVMESVVDALVTLDGRAHILSLNSSAKRLFAPLAQDPIGQSFLSMIVFALPTDEDRFKVFHESTDIARLQPLTVRLHVDAAEPIWLEMTCGRTFDGPDRLTVCSLRDVTERKRVEKLKNEFIAVVNHELRTPLTSIRASLEMLDLNFETMAPNKRARLFEIASRNSVRLSSLINDILDIQKMEAGGLVLTNSELYLDQLLKKCVELNRPYAEKFGVELQLVEPLPLLTIAGDEGRLMQILTNLTSNACKFTAASTTVFLALTQKDGRAVIRVTDQGQGIPEAFRSKIFSKFSQADSGTTRQAEGTGLGLHITRELVRAMRGDIWFETETGVGTSFFISFPLETQHTVVA